MKGLGMNSINPVNPVILSNKLKQRGEEMQFKELTEEIIGCAYKVYNTMGFGFLESVYEKALLFELRKTGLTIEAQKPITVFYEEENVGDFFADIIVNDQIILELKSVRRIAKAHETQLVNYLVATKREIGLLINFGEQRVEIKRKVRDLKQLNKVGFNN